MSATLDTADASAAAIARSEEVSEKRHRWRIRGLLALAILLYEILWVITALDIVNPTDIDVFFIPAVRYALTGHPLDIYHLRLGMYPNANGPLGLIPVYVAAWIANLRGWLDNVMLRRAFLFTLTAPFPLLAAWEAARVVERFGGVIRRWAWLLPYLTMLLAPELWLSALYYGHIEQMIAIWLTLAAIRLLSERRQIGAGALLGLALLARSDVVLLLIPIGLTLLARKQIVATARLALGGFITVAVGLAPFLIADRSDTIYSLVTFHPLLAVGGGNFWSLDNSAQAIDFATAHDTLLAIGLATVLTVIVLFFKRRLTVESSDLYLLLALSSLCFVMLIKTLWPYYYQEASLLATVWALARMAKPLAVARWRVAWRNLTLQIVVAWLPRLALLCCALLAEIGLESSNYGGWQHPWDQINGWLTIGAVIFTFGWLLLQKPIQAPNPLESPGDSSSSSDILPEIALSAAAEGVE